MDEQAPEQAPALKLRAPDWRRWRLKPTAHLWQLVLLSLDIEPDLFGGTYEFHRRAPARAVERFQIAAENITPHGRLEPVLNESEQRAKAENRGIASNEWGDKQWLDSDDARFRVADFVAVFGNAWPEHLSKLDPSIKSLAADKPLDPRERGTLYKIIAALCVLAKVNPAEWGASKPVQVTTEELGCVVGEDAVRRHLMEAAKLLPPPK